PGRAREGGDPAADGRGGLLVRFSRRSGHQPVAGRVTGIAPDAVSPCGAVYIFCAWVYQQEARCKVRRLVMILFMLQAGFLSSEASGREVDKMEKLTISSAAFAEGAAMASGYTCDGNDVSPPLAIGGVPAGSRSLALIMDDPDAPGGMWVH